MTREEAIAVFNSLAIEMTAILAGIPKNESEAKQIQRYIDAYDMAISALRQQGTVANRNEPLTLDELRRMEGQPVYIVENTEYWAIVNSFDQVGVYLLSYGNPDDYGYFRFYGKTWFAYRQKPEEDDHA